MTSKLVLFLQLSPFERWEDPRAAPGAYKGLHPAPPWTPRRAGQNMIWVYGFGLIFLLFAVATVDNGNPSTGDLIVRVGLIITIAFAYVFAAFVCDTPLETRWLYIAAFLGLLALLATFMGWGFINFGIYVSILLATLIPWRHARVAILAWGLVVIAVAALIHDWVPLSIGLTGIAIGWSTGGGIEAGRISARLTRAEHRVSVLAVTAERERISRDLHDILGHSLTAISIKAGLAAKLIDHDAPAARTQIAEVEEIARQALADVRATASGIRETRVATEIASARSVLLAAGIEGRVPSAIDPMPAEQSELFGYVVREAVTNVIRHSEASTCTITLTPVEVSISDDGTGFTERTARGSGLKGLTERATAAGGTVEVISTLGRGTEVRAHRALSGGSGGAPQEPAEAVPSR